ncbi:unnamed protein product, partial [marine sediment metagenome]
MEIKLVESQKENYRIAVMAILLTGVVSLLYYFHVFLRTSIIFTHFFYIPVVLAAIWWKRKGLIVIAALGGLLILSSALFLVSDLGNNIVRALMFFMVGFVVSMLSERITKEEKALRESEQRLKNVLEGSSIPTFVIGEDHKVIYWNRALEQLSRIKAEDVIGT